MQTELSHNALSKLLTEFDSALIKVAHSLRSPLSVISGVIEDLESGSTLTTEDIDDAKSSLQRILQELSNLRLAPLPDSNPAIASNLHSIAEIIRNRTGHSCHAKGRYTLRKPTDIRMLVAMMSLFSQSEKTSAVESEVTVGFDIEEKNDMLQVHFARTSAPSTSETLLKESTHHSRTSPTFLALDILLRSAYCSAFQARLPSNEESTLLFEIPFSRLDTAE